MAALFRPSRVDGPTIMQKIRDVFGRSPVFREALISDPLPSPDGGVSVEVRFGPTPALFRIVAPSPDKAYAVLYELASSMIQAEESRRLRPSPIRE